MTDNESSVAEAANVGVDSARLTRSPEASVVALAAAEADSVLSSDGTPGELSANALRGNAFSTA